MLIHSIRTTPKYYLYTPEFAPNFKSREIEDFRCCKGDVSAAYSRLKEFIISGITLYSYRSFASEAMKFGVYLRS